MKITEKELRDIVKTELIEEGFFDFKDSPVLKAIGLVDDAGQPALPNEEEILDPGSTGEATVDSYVLKDMTDLYMRLAEIIGNLFAGKTTMSTDEDGRPKAETAESALLTLSKEKAQANLARLEIMTTEYEEKLEALSANEASMTQEQFDAATIEVENLERQIEDLSKETEALPQNQGQLITKLIDKYFKKSFDLDNDGQIGDVDDLEMALSSMLDSKTFLAGSNLIPDIAQGMIQDAKYSAVSAHNAISIKEYRVSLNEYDPKAYKVKTGGARPFYNPSNFKEEVNEEVSDTYGFSESLINSFTSWSEINLGVKKAYSDIVEIVKKRKAEFEKHLEDWFDSYLNSDASKTFKLSIKDGNLIATFQVILLLPSRDDEEYNQFEYYTEYPSQLGNRSKESNLGLIHSLCELVKSNSFSVDELGVYGLTKSYRYKLDLPPVYGEFVERNAEWAKYTKEIEEQMAAVEQIAPDVPKIEIGKNYTEEEMQDMIDRVTLSDTSDLYEKLLKQYKQKYDEFIAQSQSTSALEGFKYIKDQNKPLPFKWFEINRLYQKYWNRSGEDLKELGIDEELAKKTTKLFCEYIESQNASYLQPITSDPIIIARIDNEKEATERKKELANKRREAEEFRKERARQAEEAQKLQQAQAAEAERKRLEVIQQKRQAAEAQRQQDLRTLGPDRVLLNDIKAFMPSLHPDGQELLHHLLHNNAQKALDVLNDASDPDSEGLRRGLKGLRTMLRNFENNGALGNTIKGTADEPSTPEYRRLFGHYYDKINNRY